MPCSHRLDDAMMDGGDLHREAGSDRRRRGGGLAGAGGLLGIVRMCAPNKFVDSGVPTTYVYLQLGHVKV